VKRRSLTAVGAAAVLVLGLGVALAHAASFNTQIEVRAFDTNPGDTDDVFTGDLKSPRSKCLPRRTVKMFKQTSSGFKLVDTDLSSKHGAWGTRGNLAGEPPLKFKVTEKRYNHGNLVCKGDTVNFP
jgi:hypothetical protein